MWDVRNKTPFAARGTMDRDADGHEFWCLLVRAQFDLHHHTVPSLSSVQTEVALAPTYTDDTQEELASDTDIIPFSPTTELLLCGDVIPPSDQLPHWDVSVQVGPIAKSARLFGARQARRQGAHWTLEGTEPVSRTSLSWRSAFGGEGHPANPIGIGAELNHPDRDLASLPLIDSTTTDILQSSGQTTPIGFGPIHRFWTPRLGFAGTYDDVWTSNRAPLLPVDFDPRFHVSAPPDQTAPSSLVGGEPCALTGFFADEHLSFRLPQVVLTARTRIDRADIDSRFSLSRISIDVSAKTLSMLWASKIPCDGRDHLVDHSYVRLKQVAGASK